MAETIRKMSNERWAKCPGCGHKVFRICNVKGTARLEFKCHSCKGIHEIVVRSMGVEE